MPIDNVKLDVYKDAMDYVFKNSDIMNVAISGTYSSGKSSILTSYKKKHSERLFLHISIAHFESKDKEVQTEQKDKTNKTNAAYAMGLVIESKILNQLIHQIPLEKIRKPISE